MNFNVNQGFDPSQINWSGFAAQASAQRFKPREIFTTTPNKLINRLRSEQTEVLDKWFDRRTDRDIVIKQNTGSGKTIVGLLIAESTQRELKKPAVYLVQNTFLVSQVVEEARKIGVSVTESLDDPRFHLAQSVLVSSYAKLLNGRSAFGVVGETTSPKDLGCVVLDDAHSAISDSTENFSVTVPSTSECFSEIFKLFRDDLFRQDAKVTADIESQDRSSAVRVSLTALQSKLEELRSILSRAAEDRSNSWIWFSWPLVVNNLAISSLTFNSRAAEIRLPCPDIGRITSFSRADRRIYLTATLQNEGALVTQLGASAEFVSRPISPKSASDIGDRLILAPKVLDVNCTDAGIRQFAYETSIGRNGRKPENVVVLVPSGHLAERWRDYTANILTVKDMNPVLDRMRAGQHVGLVVLVNKYDGVDLPNSACRLLIIDGLHHPLNPYEMRRSAALSGTSVHEEMLLQRLEQGMGRGVRDNSDFCAVLITDWDAGLKLHHFKMRQQFSPATQAQVEFSENLVRFADIENFDAMIGVVEAFLDRNEEIVKLSREAVAGIEYDLKRDVSTVDKSRRRAFEQAVMGDFGGAAQFIQDAVDSVEDRELEGWLLEERAAYLQQADASAAQKTLVAAIKRNPLVVKPDSNDWKKKPKPTDSAQAVGAARWMAQNFPMAEELERLTASFEGSISWGVPGTSNDSEDRVQQLGLLLGFDSTRPDKERRDGGPDNLWISGGRSFVIELKTEVDRKEQTIVKSEAEQLLASLQWFEDNYPHLAPPVPIMVHPYKKRHPATHLPPRTGLIGRSEFASLVLAVKNFGQDLAKTEAWNDPEDVAFYLQKHGLSVNQLVNKVRKLLQIQT